MYVHGEKERNLDLSVKIARRYKECVYLFIFGGRSERAGVKYGIDSV